MPPPSSLHPELQSLRWIPSIPFNRFILPLMRGLQRLIPARAPEGITVENVWIPGPPGAPDVRVRKYEPPQRAPGSAALLWIHGGGYLIGRPEQSDTVCARFARELGILVVAVDYRLAPEHPFPAPLEDCYAALSWMHAQAGALKIDADRLAIGGDSAGGGLAAALAQLTRDRKQIKPVFQLLLYPMLDDRTATRADHKGTGRYIWTPGSNVLGWTSYLGQAPGAPTTPKHAVPARMEDLTGLPPAWVGVGTLDLFHEEDVAYARRLQASGVPCELHEVPGAFHAFELFAGDAAISRDFIARQVSALKRALAARG
ncbi:alpha/beta hydrolase [Archangium sp.]|uniref:alpha/beta hydrolase n=1 Tax=Archangium sp. TaxID=1872627 RepID=UPI00389A8AAB